MEEGALSRTELILKGTLLNLVLITMGFVKFESFMMILKSGYKPTLISLQI